MLGDLNHSHPFVRRTLLDWVHDMVQNYSRGLRAPLAVRRSGLDALRLDTAVYVDPNFLVQVQEVAGVQVLGEATVNNLTFQASLMHGDERKGLRGLLNFPPFYQLPRGFCGYRIGGDFGDYSLQGGLHHSCHVISIIKTINKHIICDITFSFHIISKNRVGCRAPCGGTWEEEANLLGLGSVLSLQQARVSNLDMRLGQATRPLGGEDGQLCRQPR